MRPSGQQCVLYRPVAVLQRGPAWQRPYRPRRLRKPRTPYSVRAQWHRQATSLSIPHQSAPHNWPGGSWSLVPGQSGETCFDVRTAFTNRPAGGLGQYIVKYGLAGICLYHIHGWKLLRGEKCTQFLFGKSPTSVPRTLGRRPRWARTHR